MAASIMTLKDSTGANDIYPKTKALAVILENGKSTEEAISSLRNIFISTSSPNTFKAGDIWIQTDS